MSHPTRVRPEYQRPATTAVTAGTIREWGRSLGLPVGPRQPPKGLIERWNREHPDRPYKA